MLTYKNEPRYYSYFNSDGKERYRKVTYKLWFNENTLVEVTNEFNCTVEKNSECWEFFKSKYSC